MALEKLSLVGYKDKNFSKKQGSSFVVMINPSSYNHSYSVSLKGLPVSGKSHLSPDFKSVGPETVSFEFILDDTGVVSRNKENEGKSVHKMIKELKDVVYKYNGNTHEPNFVLLKWGTLIFKSRLSNLDVNYQMFKPNGLPLRAKVKMVFKGFVDPVTEAKLANRSSPDLTHIITVKEGDNLPLLCQKVYNNSKYYIKIAEINELVNIRRLVVGSKLIFPPLN